MTLTKTEMAIGGYCCDEHEAPTCPVKECGDMMFVMEGGKYWLCDNCGLVADMDGRCYVQELEPEWCALHDVPVTEGQTCSRCKHEMCGEDGDSMGTLGLEAR